MNDIHEKVKKFLETYDWKGLAEAYQKQQIEFGAKDWENFVTHIRSQTRKETLEEVRYGKICLNCGNSKENTLSDLCGECLETI